MATKSVKAVQLVERTIPMNVGIAVGTVIDSESDLVCGYKAARDPALVSARKIANEQRRLSLTAQLLADLKG